MHNLVRFCELCVRRGIVRISIVTASDETTAAEQRSTLNDIKTSLAKHGVQLEYSFDPARHDRDIALDNGWLIRLGRGLDYFKRAEPQFSIGSHDFDLRPCFQCNIDVWQDVKGLS